MRDPIPSFQSQRRIFCCYSAEIAHRVFDSDLLKDIIQELSGQMPNVSRITGFTGSKGVLTVVDGTLIEVVPLIYSALVDAGDDAGQK